MRPLFFFSFSPAENLFHCAPSSSFPPKPKFWRRQERAHHGCALLFFPAQTGILAKTREGTPRRLEHTVFFRNFIKIVKWNLFVLSPYKLSNTPFPSYLSPLHMKIDFMTCQWIKICIWIKPFFHKKAQRLPFKQRRKETQSTELFVRSLYKLFNFNLGFLSW